MKDYTVIPLNECKHGYLYSIKARNLDAGIFDKNSSGFLGIRSKFGDEFLFEEYHVDMGPPCGTVTPQKCLKKCTANMKKDDELLKWLKKNA
jgi:hypothetical protein